ncbi:MAG: hypothetical protein AAF250_03695 [Pseudomonadota bacterium]
MDGDLVIIMGSIIVMLIVVGMSINGIVAKVFAHEAAQKENGGQTSDPLAQEIAARTDMIEDRLAVLERIATDRGQLLSDEIEQLRIEVKAEESHQ